MVHERWRRMVALWRREAGRTDPVWPPEGMWTCGATIGEWGRSTAHLASVQKLDNAYETRRSLLIQRQREEIKEFDRQWTRHQQRLDLKARRVMQHQKHIRMSPDGVMTWVDGPDEVELLRFIGTREAFIAERRTKKRGEHAATVLINGDGFDDRTLQRVQAEIRRDMQTEFGQLGCMVVPHQALTAAGIRVESVRRIQVTRDGTNVMEVKVKPPLQKDIDQAAKEATETVSESHRKQSYWTSSWHRFRSEGRDYQIRVAHSPRETTQGFQVWHQPLDDVPGWANVNHLDWTVRESQHRLGACVFSAIDRTGARHRFISGFDMQEQPPLYFLAQLPDRGRMFSVQDAILLLAPPIVHKAREANRQVYRQGDVFFVETSLSDADIRNRSGRIVEGSTSQDQPRRGRDIYRTGHIATRVARMRSGVQLAAGRVEHWPMFTEADRRPEHRPLQLPDDRWFLCIRNTVPRQASQDSDARRRDDQPIESVEGRETNVLDNVA